MFKLRFVSSLLFHKELLWRLTERSIASRYRGSFLGFGWTLLQPVVMLCVYTFVFSTVFKSRWAGMEEAGSLGYAVNLFAGLIVFNFFADCIGSSPGLIVANKNYVTKVIFPLELLGASVIAAAVFQAFTSTIILILFNSWFSIMSHFPFFSCLWFGYLLCSVLGLAGCSHP